MQSQWKWGGVVAAVILAGILSRTIQTGFVLLDKYLGDALYAVMVYGLMRLFWRRAVTVALAGVTMVAIEAFQLTGVPARMLASDWWATRVAGRLLGTQFNWWDLVAYAAGIGFVFSLDKGKPDVTE